MARLLAQAERPVLVLGSDIWADRAEDAARRCVQALGLPVVANGQGRGILPRATTACWSPSTRSSAPPTWCWWPGLRSAFRLGYGSFGGRGRTLGQGGPPGRRPDQVAGHVQLAGSVAGDLGLILDGLTQGR